MPNRLALPLSVTGSGSFSTITQDSDDDVAQCVALVLATPVGDRRACPGFGLPDPLGRGLDADTVAVALELWEPRADAATVVASMTDAAGDQAAAVYLT